MESKLDRMIRNNLKMKQETSVKLNTLEKLLKLIFKEKSNYSQLVIDAVELFEKLLYSPDTTKEEFFRFRYDLDNIFEVIDKTRVYDCDALDLLRVLVNSELETV
jgi:hypothetical protein